MIVRIVTADREMGFFANPHTGCVPTSKGYRLFVAASWS